MTTSVGVSAFGFNDGVSVVRSGVTAEGATVPTAGAMPQSIPACVVMKGAAGRSAAVLTGMAAARSRVHTGFHWPEESHLPTKLEDLRRLPVSLLWERFVASKGRPCDIAGQPVEALLKAHVDAVMPVANDVRRVLAIPNALTTSSQERLLRAFGLERRNVTLLWRPIAAVLGWLDRLDRCAFDEFEAKNGWVGVCYMGVDGVEFTKVQLDLSRDDFVVPVRSRPKPVKSEQQVDGFDLLEDWLNGSEYTEATARWQAALRMSDLWRQTSGRFPEGSEELWSLDGRWAVWRPAKFKQKGHALAVPFTHELRGRSTQGTCTLDERLRAYAREVFSQSEGEACLGLIVCGALAPAKGMLPGWLMTVENDLGITLKTFGQSVAVKSLYIAEEDLVARGARIYGERLLHNEACLTEAQKLPTYFDTLPKMQLYVATSDALVWQPLFESDHCEGGKSVTNVLDVFALRAGSVSVEIWLMMLDEDVEPEALPESITEDLERTPYSFAEVSFVKSHPEEIKLSLTASMQPSSGFASVSFKPQNPRFNDILKSEGVYLTIDDMAPKRRSELPKIKLSWPLDGKRALFTGEGEDFTYCYSNLDKLCHDLNRKKKRREDGTQYFYRVNEEGKHANCINEKIWGRLLKDVSEFSRRDDQWLRVGSWLWRACPEIVRKRIIEKMKASYNVVTIGYAARVAKTPKEIEAVLVRIRAYLEQKATDGDFGSVLSRNATVLLDMNPMAAEVLAGKPLLLDFLLERIAKNLNRLSNPYGETVKLLKYQWLPSLLAAILKVRKWNKTFLRDPKEVDLWVQRIERLNPAVETFVRLNGCDPKLARVLQENYAAIIDYIRGCGNDVPLLTEDVDDKDS